MSNYPMSPITRFTSVAFSDTEGSPYKALYTPRLPQDQVIAIPVSDELIGAIVFNTDTEELETYTAAGFWLPILTAESDINVDTITVETLNAENIITTSITSSAINSSAINNEGGMNTISLNVYTSISSGAITTATMEVSADFSVEGALAGVTSNTDVSPLTVVLSTGAGTGATSNIKGSLTSGVFTLNTGTLPVTGGVIGTFTIPASSVDHFNGSYGVMFSAVNSATLPFPVYVTTGVSPSTFTIGLGAATTLAESTQYKWNYHIIGSKK
jgi:hypothetical protein